MELNLISIIGLGMMVVVCLGLLALLFVDRKNGTPSRIGRIVLGGFAILIGAGSLVATIANPANPPGGNGVVFSLILGVIFLFGGLRLALQKPGK